MRVVRLMLQYILTIILAMSVLALVLINIISSTVLNESYIMSKLEEEDYYNQIYKSAESNFENYIHQSGLDEEVLNNIITKEKIEKDTKIIINNIFDGTDTEIDTDEIKNKLNENIDNSLGRKKTATEEKAINEFVNLICNEYKTTILTTSYESKINTAYQKVIKYINLAKKVLLILIGVLVILIVLLTIKRIYRILARLGLAFVIDGLLFLLAKYFIDAKIKIETITILSSSVSIVLRNILREIINIVAKDGTILLVLGIVLIVLYAIIKSIRKSRRLQDQYDPEK